MKKLHARELSRNQSILRFDIILQHDWPIEQCLPHIRVFFHRKTKSPCFDLFIHGLIRQITNTYRNHFQGHTKFALSKSWGLRASFTFSPLPLPLIPLFCSRSNFLDELTRKRLLRRLKAVVEECDKMWMDMDQTASCNKDHGSLRL